MARRRRKNQNDGAGGLLVLLFAVLAILILAASVIGTAALFGLAIRNYWRVRKLPYAESMADFDLSTREHLELGKASLRVAQHGLEIQAIEQRGKGRATRADGKYHERGIGIELNEQMDAAKASLYDAEGDVSELQYRPGRRADWYIGLRAEAASGASSVMVLGVAFLALLVAEPKPVLGYAEWLAEHIPGAHAAELSHVFASASLSCVVGWLAYWVGTSAFAAWERRRLLNALPNGG